MSAESPSGPVENLSVTLRFPDASTFAARFANFVERHRILLPGVSARPPGTRIHFQLKSKDNEPLVGGEGHVESIVAAGAIPGCPPGMVLRFEADEDSRALMDRILKARGDAPAPLLPPATSAVGGGGEQAATNVPGSPATPTRGIPAAPAPGVRPAGGAAAMGASAGAASPLARPPLLGTRGTPPPLVGGVGGAARPPLARPALGARSGSALLKPRSTMPLAPLVGRKLDTSEGAPSPHAGGPRAEPAISSARSAAEDPVRPAPPAPAARDDDSRGDPVAQSVAAAAAQAVLPSGNATHAPVAAEAEPLAAMPVEAAPFPVTGHAASHPEVVDAAARRDEPLVEAPGATDAATPGAGPAEGAAPLAAAPPSPSAPVAAAAPERPDKSGPLRAPLGRPGGAARGATASFAVPGHRDQTPLFGARAVPKAARPPAVPADAPPDGPRANAPANAPALDDHAGGAGGKEGGERSPAAHGPPPVPMRKASHAPTKPLVGLRSQPRAIAPRPTGEVSRPHASGAVVDGRRSDATPSGPVLAARSHSDPVAAAPAPATPAVAVEGIEALLPRALADGGPPPGAAAAAGPPASFAVPLPRPSFSDDPGDITPAVQLPAAAAGGEPAFSAPHVRARGEASDGEHASEGASPLVPNAGAATPALPRLEKSDAPWTPPSIESLPPSAGPSDRAFRFRTPPGVPPIPVPASSVPRRPARPEPSVLVDSGSPFREGAHAGALPAPPLGREIGLGDDEHEAEPLGGAYASEMPFPLVAPPALEGRPPVLRAPAASPDDDDQDDAYGGGIAASLTRPSRGRVWFVTLCALAVAAAIGVMLGTFLP